MNSQDTPFQYHRPVNPSDFVDRDTELSSILNGLIYQGNNVNLFGNPGIGKSSLLGKLQIEIENHYKDVLLVHLFLMSFVKASGTDLARAYLKNEKMTCTLPKCHVFLKYYDTTRRTI